MAIKRGEPKEATKCSRDDSRVWGKLEEKQAFFYASHQALRPLTSGAEDDPSHGTHRKLQGPQLRAQLRLRRARKPLPEV